MEEVSGFSSDRRASGAYRAVVFTPGWEARTAGSLSLSVGTLKENAPGYRVNIAWGCVSLLLSHRFPPVNSRRIWNRNQNSK